MRSDHHIFKILLVAWVGRLACSFHRLSHSHLRQSSSSWSNPPTSSSLRASECFEGDQGNALEEFIELLQSSLRRDTFCGVSMSSRRVPSTGGIDIEAMRGGGALVEGGTVDGDTTKTRKSKVAEVSLTDDLIRVDGRLIALKAGIHLHMNAKYKTNDQAKNFPIEGNTLSKELRRLLTLGSFKRAELITETANYQLTISKTAKTLKVKSASNVVPQPSEATHDRKKNLPIDPEATFLQALKVVNKEGRPLSGMKDKLRQIEKFVEILSGLVEKAGRQRTSIGTLSITDMGSGLAYLTFASHAYFSEKLEGTEGEEGEGDEAAYAAVKTVGIENRLSLVEKTNKIARELGNRFDGLSFRHASIEDLHSDTAGMAERGAIEIEKREKGIDVLIALHACDTATDDAIFQGISSGADVIVTAPCCHKEVRPQLDSLAMSSSTAMLSYGIYRERQGEMVTDTIRAKCLEESGYDVTVAEFIGGEHTAKNVMIAAVKRADAAERMPSSGDTDGDAASARGDIEAIADAYAIHSQKLVSLLGMEELLLTPTSDIKTVMRAPRSKKMLPRLRPRQAAAGKVKRGT